jgi:hypothetical protein
MSDKKEMNKSKKQWEEETGILLIAERSPGAYTLERAAFINVVGNDRYFGDPKYGENGEMQQKDEETSNNIIVRVERTPVLFMSRRHFTG